MSISSEISRISGNITDSLAAVAAKGVTVPSGSNSDDLAGLIAQISTSMGAITIQDVEDSAGGTIRKIIGVNIGDTTATAADVASGKYFYTAAGVKTQGTASGGSGVTEKDVNFIDYDGTIIYSYTAQEAQALTELPANPTHTGLTSQGWNWTLADIKSQLTNVGDKVWVGQTYKTSSGKTEIYLNINNAPINTRAQVNGTAELDWGDGSQTIEITGTTGSAINHHYYTKGNYCITYESKASGTVITIGTTGTNTSSNKIAYVLYPYCGANFASQTLVPFLSDKIRLYDDINIANFAFCFAGMENITIPSEITSIGMYAFYYCKRLKGITIPDGVDTVQQYAFYLCENIEHVSLPSSVTSIGNYAFDNTYKLKSITIPEGVTTIGSYAFENSAIESVILPSSVTTLNNSAFRNCMMLESVTFKGNSITTIPTYCFNTCTSLHDITFPSSVTTIKTNAFEGCTSLTNITIPATITSIEASAFTSCYGMQEYHFLAENPPTLGTYVFSNIVAGTVIYVPVGSLTAYQTATNWSTYASYIQEEPQ